MKRSDEVARLQALDLPVVVRRAANTLACLRQPCSAYQEGKCRVYADRPQYCREFECRLLQEVKSGRTTFDQARRTISDARRKVEKILRLFRKLGDCQEHSALKARFRRITRRMEAGGRDRSEVLLYGQLTQQYHELNQLLGSAFYP
jgi:Fe-S-cluster containining protein